MQQHPFEPFIPKGAKRLIIGSIPPARFCKDLLEPIDRPLYEEDVQFYYGSNDNSFWDLIGQASGKNFVKKNSPEAVTVRQSFLEETSTGILDIITKCRRKNDGASDTDLYEFEADLIDLHSILESNPDVNTLIYTSDFVKKWVAFQLSKSSPKTLYHEINQADKRKQSLKLHNGKVYQVIVLYSPSPQALRGMPENGAELRLKQYKEVFAI